MIRKVVRALVFMVETILAPAGTNFLGLAVVLAAFLPLAFFIKKLGANLEGYMEGLVIFIAGGIVFGIDWSYRRLGPREFYADESLDRLKYEAMFDWNQGARLLFLPIWIWGVIWIIVGLIKLILTLVKG
jgi:uncharacterized membrane protein